jgi:phosphoadenosine phosphosulfate reductase
MDRVSELSAKYFGLTGEPLVRQLVEQNEFEGRFVVASSFGIDSAALLSIVSEVKRSLPVVFVDTRKLFPETLAYRDKLIKRLRLTNVQTVSPSLDAIKARDPNGTLWEVEEGARCCTLRKVEPFQRALAGCDAFITGRIPEDGDSLRANMSSFEKASFGRIRINPLAYMTWKDVRAIIDMHRLPHHPKEDEFSSIGCLTCTHANSVPTIVAEAVAS